MRKRIEAVRAWGRENKDTGRLLGRAGESGHVVALPWDSIVRVRIIREADYRKLQKAAKKGSSK